MGCSSVQMRVSQSARKKAGVGSEPGPVGSGLDPVRVFGDSDFIANPGLHFNGNRDIFLRVLGWLLGEDATFLTVEDRENRRIPLSNASIAWMYIVNLSVLPLTR